MKRVCIIILVLLVLFPIVSADGIAFWTDNNKRPITEYNAVKDISQLMLILENSGLNQGDLVNFTIKENDWGMDDTVRILSSSIDENGNAEVTWLVTTEDLEKGAPSSEGLFDEDNIYELGEFYFEVEGEPSGFLQLVVINKESFCKPISFCRDYETQGDCETDVCGVDNKSVEMDYGSNICEKVSVDNGCEIKSDCSCQWKNGVCGPNKRDIRDCGENPFVIGDCFYSEYSSDDCEDGFLEYSWEGIYGWYSENIFGFEKEGEEGYIEDSVGVWHYDPQRENERCLDGSNIVQCPSYALVPFFNIFSVAAAIIIIITAYYFLSKRKKKR